MRPIRVSCLIYWVDFKHVFLSMCDKDPFLEVILNKFSLFNLSQFTVASLVIFQEERLPTHRRTESCDENNLSAISSPPSSSPYLPGASPRPRNRIRTNPWLPCSPGGSVVKLTTDSSAVDSSSTVSSTSCREKHVSPHKKLASPRKKPKEIGSKVSSPIVSRR